MPENLIPRSDKALHDQMIQHEVNNKSAEQLLAMLVIEVRRLREDMAGYHSPRTQFVQQQRIVRPEDNGSGPAG